jgi:hypothetical protein
MTIIIGSQAILVG